MYWQGRRTSARAYARYNLTSLLSCSDTSERNFGLNEGAIIGEQDHFRLVRQVTRLRWHRSSKFREH